MTPTPAAARAELARRSLAHFIRYIDIPGVPRTARGGHFITPEFAAHHACLIDALQGLADGRFSNLMVFMPPGSAKSTYCSVVYPAWRMARSPDHQVILASYASGLARKLGRKTRSLIASPRFAALFPGLSLRGDSKAADDFALTNRSEYLAGGILSGITGHRADDIIVDDPVKGRAEAESALIRRRTLEAWEDDLRTRAKPGAKKLIVQTRWHEDDLSGAILPEDWDGESGDIKCRDGEVWRVIRIPAKAEADDLIGRKPGEYLWPEWFPKSHWTAPEQNPRTWASLYQGRPSPGEGIQFKREWFQHYDEPPEALRLYAASDYAVSQNSGDWTVHMVAGLDADDNLYILDLWRAQARTDEWIEAVCDLTAKWKPELWAEEGGVIVKAVEPALIKRLNERKTYLRRQSYGSTTDKVARTQAICARMAMGKVWLPRRAPWRGELEHELLAFPAGRHDDQVDALSLLGRMLADMHPARRTPKTKAKNRDRYDHSGSERPDWKVV